MKNLVNRFWLYWDRYGIVVILLVALVIFAILTPEILAIDQLLGILSNSTTVAIAALGMTFAICSGGFDLSVGSIAALCTCVWAALLTGLSGVFGPVGALILASLITLLVGAICGILNGLVVTKLKIVTFVATLSMSMIFRSFAQTVTDGKKQMIQFATNPEAKIFAQNFEIFGQSVNLVSILMMITVYIVGYFIYRQTRFGVHTRSVGSNEISAKTSGVPTDRTLIIVFVLTGITAAMAALIQASRNMQGSTLLFVGFELDVITATILGGTSLAGGKGNIWGSMVASILLALVRSGLNMMGAVEEYQRLAIGGILLLALMISGIQELVKEAQE